jgi:putative membrane protein
MKKTILLLMTVASLNIRAQAPSSDDVKFANEIAQANMHEIKLGQLAVSKGSSQVVKDLGQMMIDDHTKAGKELKAWASKKGITLPSAIDKEGQDAYNELAKKSGNDFDKAYTEKMVKGHEKVRDKMKKESQSGDDKDLKEWAGKTLPTIEHHLMMSKEANAKVK